VKNYNSDPYFNGSKLYGDDFGCESIKEWFEGEKEAYSKILGGNYNYEYHELNKFHAFDKLGKKYFEKVLLFGGASGLEILPIIQQVGEIFAIEPSMEIRKNNLSDKKINYINPNADASISFGDGSFNLITCFSVLHHIPNVSYAIRELARVLKPGGFLLLREPIISMGDWNTSRKYLTKRERGIPADLLNDMLINAGLKTIYSKKIVFPLTRRFSFNNKITVMLDAILSSLFAWNYHYHAQNIFQKIQPGVMAYILEKNNRAALEE
jgi:ubiquinone/menaquinone biosynthesis C-methylase UbiE